MSRVSANQQCKLFVLASLVSLLHTCLLRHIISLTISILSVLTNVILALYEVYTC